MLGSEIEKWVDDIENKKCVVDNALTLGLNFYDDYNNETDYPKKGDIIMFSPQFIHNMSTDKWTYEDAVKYNKTDHDIDICIFRQYEVISCDLNEHDIIYHPTLRVRELETNKTKEFIRRSYISLYWLYVVKLK